MRRRGSQHHTQLHKPLLLWDSTPRAFSVPPTHLQTCITAGWPSVPVQDAAAQPRSDVAAHSSCVKWPTACQSAGWEAP